MTTNVRLHQHFPEMRTYDFPLAKEPLVFLGDVSDEFASSRLKIWGGFHPDIRAALTVRNIVPAAAENASEADRAKWMGSKYKRPRSPQHFFLRKTDGGFHTLDAPRRDASSRDLFGSFGQAIALALDHSFKFSRQPGFHQALSSDTVNGVINYDKTPETAQFYFIKIWANRFGDNAHSYYPIELGNRCRASWEWVGLNTPSDNKGFNFNRSEINGYDRAHRTPLENLLFAAGSTGLKAAELRTVLQAGANAFQINRDTERSAVDELMARKDVARISIVLEETAKNALFAGIAKDVKDDLRDFVRFEFPAGTKKAALKAIAALPDAQKFPRNFFKRPPDPHCRISL